MAYWASDRSALTRALSLVIHERWQAVAVLSPDDRPLVPVLGDDEVHVLHFSLDQERSGMEVLLQALNETERTRADRFIRPIHQTRFANGRAILRQILGLYVGKGSGSVEFTYGPQGKPALVHGVGERPLEFNLSHSEDQALCALAWERPVGVDIEGKRERIAAEAIARRYFGLMEIEALAAQENSQSRQEVFYQYWTAKEALLKGVGGGLTVALDRCEFSLDTNPFALALTDLPEISQANWNVYGLHGLGAYAGAVAISGGGGIIINHSWNPLSLETWPHGAQEPLHKK